MKRLTHFLLYVVASTIGYGQVIKPQSINILFIGNSYTYYHNMPDIFGALTQSMGDSVYIQSTTPGGYTLEQHTKDATTIHFIQQGIWDVVVLQEQSQLPSLPIRQVEQQFYPFALRLDSLIHQYNKNAKTIFYMTWGRKNGDAGNCNVWKPVCTYEGMDSLIALRYTYIAKACQAGVAPVGSVWKHLVHHNPGIELYDQDGSHPSMKGSYLAACCLYTTIFNKNPESITFNFKLNAGEAAVIKKAVKTILYDSWLNEQH